MMFIASSESIDLTVYVKKYGNGEAVSRNGINPTFSVHNLDTMSEPDWPPLVDLTELQNTSFTPEIKAYLQKSEPIARARFRQRFPILPDESIIEDSVTALREDWNSFEAGTFVYKRTTNMGTIAFGIPAMRIDLKSGKTLYLDRQEEVRLPEIEFLTLASSDDLTPTLIESALTIAEFAGFALGPEGLILSGGAAVLNIIFHKLLSKDKVSLSSQIQAAVDQTITKAELQNIDATITTDFNWLKDYYDAAWDNDPPPPTEEEYKDFKTALSNKLSSDTGLLQQVNLLMEPSYKVPGFPLFLLGAGLVILLHKIQLIIASSDKSVVDTRAFQALKNNLERYINHGKEVINELDGSIQSRLEKVTDVYRDTRCISHPTSVPVGPKGGLVTICNAEWDYKDGENIFRFPDTTTPEGCKARHHQHKDSAKRSRSKHITKLKAELNKRYYDGKPQEAKDIVQKWQDTLKDYKKFE